MGRHGRQSGKIIFMKKILILALVVIAFAFNTEKKLQVELTAEQWNGVLQVIDQSNAPHSDVKIVSKWLVDQIKPQIQDTTKQK